jgi:AcrR family transcriptional regulator
VAKREPVRTSQRLGLTLAMIDAIAENGYGATTVGDVVARARVSRKTFYQIFGSRQACLLSTFDVVADQSLRRVEEAHRAAEGRPGRLEATIRSLFECGIASPGALRLSLLEIGAVGATGIERRERSTARYELLIRDGLEFAPGEGGLSDAVLKAVLGGLNGVLYRRLLRGERAELLALVPDLVTWASSYHPTPAAILAELSRSRSAGESPRRVPEGGRAPGTLAPPERPRRRRGLPPGNQSVSRSFVVHSQRERILDAVTNLTAAHGYAELKLDDIAEQAAVSLNAFYEHFADKEDAFLVAFEVGRGKALAAVERGCGDESDAPVGVGAGIAALFGFLAAEPSFAHLALVDAPIATARTAERSRVGLDAFARVLVRGLEDAPGRSQPSAVTIEAIAGGLFELCLHHALQGRTDELPELTMSATYIALAPFLGSEEAVRVAIGSGGDDSGDR